MRVSGLPSRQPHEVHVSAVSICHHGRTVTQYLYSRYGIPEYCPLALPDPRLEVYRDLAVDGYRSVTMHAAGNLVAPVFVYRVIRQ